MTAVEIPDDLVTLLGQSRLAVRPQPEQVRIILAMTLAQEGVISVGKAAELAEMPRVSFEQLMVDLGFVIARYDVTDYERDLQGWADAGREASRP